MCKAIQDMMEESEERGEMRGIQIGEERGEIIGVIRSFKLFGKNQQETLRYIMEELGVDRQMAEKYIRECW